MENDIEKVETSNRSDSTTENSRASAPSGADPGIEQVYKYLMFGLSLPERTIRSTAAMVGGAIHESASLLVPQAFQDSKTYQTFVRQMLDLLNEDVGGVGKDVPGDDDSSEVESYVAKKAVSTFVDLAGMATLHVSPMTILAIVCDVAYGSKTYLNELADELKREGVIAQDSTISNAAQLLEAVAVASSDSADALDMPPVSVDGLSETIQRTTANIAEIDPTKLIPQAEAEQLWADMKAMADRENVNVFEISSAMTMYTLEHVNTVSKGALTTIRVTGDLVDRHLFDHYRQSLQDIADRGIYAMLADSSQPYLDAVWFNFSSDRPTLTEDIVTGKIMGRAWEGVKGWFGESKNDEK